MFLHNICIHGTFAFSDPRCLWRHRLVNLTNVISCIFFLISNACFLEARVIALGSTTKKRNGESLHWRRKMEDERMVFDIFTFATNGLIWMASSISLLLVTTNRSTWFLSSADINAWLQWLRGRATKLVTFRNENVLLLIINKMYEFILKHNKRSKRVCVRVCVVCLTENFDVRNTEIRTPEEDRRKMKRPSLKIWIKIF